MKIDIAGDVLMNNQLLIVDLLPVTSLYLWIK